MTQDQPRRGFGRTTSEEWKHHRNLPDDPGMTPAEIHGPREATAALDDHLARSLRLVVPVLASIYAVSLLSGRTAGTVTPSQALVTAAALVLALAFVLRPVPARVANPILAGGLAAIAIEALVRGVDAAPNLSLALVGAGAVALRPRWAIASAAAVLGPWLAAATMGLWGWRLDDHVTAELAAAAAMGAVVFEARHGSVAGLIAARGVMHALALTDPLTGLLNRRGIEEEAGRMLATGAAELSIVYLDLDGFKAVNDRLGHAEGDRALQAMAEILLETFRTADAVGRIGGDEFVIVVAPGSDATVAARRLQLHLDTWRHAEDRYTLRASIGVGHVASATLDSFWEAVDAADRRMYSEKQARWGRETHPAAAPAMVPVLS
jgi:diguanylate cyclase (GGDEF)-like protein